MTKTEPAQVRVRAYNVGFGDCFLLSFDYQRGRTRHVLIDFGSTRLPAKSRGGPKSMVQVAEQIRLDCDGKLDIVVATHRHADHISGFAGAAGSVIAGLEPDLVVQPWTEDPELAPDATSPMAPAGRSSRHRAAATAAVARLTDMHALAALVAREGARLATTQGVPKNVAAQLSFLGEENLANLEAVENLQSLGRKRIYAHFGSRLPRRLLPPGVDVDVLGPPTLEQSAAIRGEARTDPDEFWHLAASTARARLATGNEPIFPRARTAKRFPQEARWLIPQIERMNAEDLLGIVRILDDAMNNTSLILLLTVGDLLLLFPGDAQIENWRYALSDAPNSADIRARLAGTHVYKVGHHGSLNATPRQLLWGAFSGKQSRPSTGRLITIMSTLAGKHGSETRGTEVPRRTLTAELRRNSTLYTTQEETTSKQFWRDVVLPVPPGHP